jgi:hypothetical protein
MGDMPSTYAIEILDESGGFCDCCGEASRSVWGLVHHGDATVAAYWMHWTVGHLDEPGANLDIVIGAWGETATPSHRQAVSLLYRQPEDQPPAFMVIDATDRPIAKSALVGGALRREDVIGTPLADHVFGLVDAICLQDSRFF